MVVYVVLGKKDLSQINPNGVSLLSLYKFGMIYDLNLIWYLTPCSLSVTSVTETILKPLIPLEKERTYLQAYAIAVKIDTILPKPIVPSIKGLRFGIVSFFIVLMIISLF
jgi:hypothetical protein